MVFISKIEFHSKSQFNFITKPMNRDGLRSDRMSHEGTNYEFIKLNFTLHE